MMLELVLIHRILNQLHNNMVKMFRPPKTRQLLDRQLQQQLLVTRWQQLQQLLRNGCITMVPKDLLH